MDLRTLLLERLNGVAELALKPGLEVEFVEAYQRLFQEIATAIQVMREMAVAQATWKSERVGQMARDN